MAAAPVTATKASDVPRRALARVEINGRRSLLRTSMARTTPLTTPARRGSVRWPKAVWRARWSSACVMTPSSASKPARVRAERTN
jgi:hypothetical protein